MGDKNEKTASGHRRIGAAGRCRLGRRRQVGILIGFTGPIESLTSHMAAAAELAMEEANDSGKLLGGATVVPVRADFTCVDAAAATAAAERLVTAEGVKGIIGGDCSGVTGAVLQNVARPNGIVMVSPSATSPALSTAEDDGLFFRTAPSDAREGEVMADILTEKGVKSIALTYSNNDYGKGLAEAIAICLHRQGRHCDDQRAHEDGKADYSAEVAALAAAGGDLLVVAGYLDQGGKGIIQASLDTGAFTHLRSARRHGGRQPARGHRPGAGRLLRPGCAVGQRRRCHPDRNGQGRHGL